MVRRGQPRGLVAVRRGRLSSQGVLAGSTRLGIDGYAGGRPRYGWRAIDSQLVEDPADQAVIAQRISMRAEGAFLRVIAGALAEAGVRSTGRKASWTPAAISGYWMQVLGTGPRRASGGDASGCESGSMTLIAQPSYLTGVGDVLVDLNCLGSSPSPPDLHYMNPCRRLNAATSALESSNHSPCTRLSANRSCQ